MQLFFEKSPPQMFDRVLNTSLIYLKILKKTTAETYGEACVVNETKSVLSTKSKPHGRSNRNFSRLFSCCSETIIQRWLFSCCSETIIQRWLFSCCSETIIQRYLPEVVLQRIQRNWSSQENNCVGDSFK